MATNSILRGKSSSGPMLAKSPGGIVIYGFTSLLSAHLQLGLGIGGSLVKDVSNMHFLVAIAGRLGAIAGRKRFQKTVFLVQERLNSFNYNFTSYLYGPYSPQLQNDIDLLVRMGYLKESNDGIMYSYEMTRLGRENAKRIQKRFTKKQLKKMDGYLDELKNVNTEDLVSQSKSIMAKKVEDNVFG